MNDLIAAVADLLRGGIVIEKDGENAVRIRLEADKPAVEGNDAEGWGHNEVRGW